MTICDESGNAQYHGSPGRFASEDAAINFATKWGLAFTNGDTLPYPFNSSIARSRTERHVSMHAVKSRNFVH